MKIAIGYGRYAVSYMVTINAVLASLSNTTYDRAWITGFMIVLSMSILIFFVMSFVAYVFISYFHHIISTVCCCWRNSCIIFAVLKYFIIIQKPVIC